MSTPANNKYAPPQSIVADVSSTEGAFEKASRGSRLGAAILDGLIFSLPLMPSYIAGFNAVIHSGGRPNALVFWGAMVAAGTLFYVGLLIDLVLLVVTAVLVQRNAQTIGKKIAGIKVARKDGSRATLGRIFWLRNFVNSLLGLIPLIGPFYGLVDVLMIFGEARRCCHDYIADTIVIRA
ncbi:MAG TPA: RDD family protein [Steroidobacteraceae bacterium]|nr:RDD family protein [Steroidobacteraceae bacterium]